MTIGDYLLIPIIIFILMLYPLLRKGISLFEIYVSKCVQQKSREENSAGKNNPSQTLLHLKLLAYERVVLLIERLKPDSLIPRTLTSSLTCKEYQLLLIQEIRKEYEYNLSQQLYLSDNAWNITVNFKDNIITLINSAAVECPANSQANLLAQKILERYITADLKAEQILEAIKKELKTKN